MQLREAGTILRQAAAAYESKGGEESEQCSVLETSPPPP